MSNAPPPPHAPRLDDAIAYHYGELSPEARAEFETHLETCPACRHAVATANVVFPALPAVLAARKRRRTTDEILALMDAEQRRLDAEERVARARPRRWPFWVLGGAVAAAAAALLIAHFTPMLAAPKRPEPPKIRGR